MTHSWEICQTHGQTDTHSSDFIGHSARQGSKNCTGLVAHGMATVSNILDPFFNFLNMANENNLQIY